MNRYCWFVRSDRACAELGYQARPVEQTLIDTLAWFRRRRNNLALDRLNRWWMRPGRTPRPALVGSRVVRKARKIEKTALAAPPRRPPGQSQHGIR
jgi:hypothetical protein